MDGLELVLAGDHREPLDPATLESGEGRLRCRVRRGALLARFGRLALQQLGRLPVGRGRAARARRSAAGAIPFPTTKGLLSPHDRRIDRSPPPRRPRARQEEADGGGARPASPRHEHPRPSRRPGVHGRRDARQVGAGGQHGRDRVHHSGHRRVEPLHAARHDPRGPGADPCGRAAERVPDPRDPGRLVPRLRGRDARGHHRPPPGPHPPDPPLPARRGRLRRPDRPLLRLHVLEPPRPPGGRRRGPRRGLPLRRHAAHLPGAARARGSSLTRSARSTSTGPSGPTPSSTSPARST